MQHKVKSPVTGSVWQCPVAVGQDVTAGSNLLILESMKMEIPIEAPVDGVVEWVADVGSMVEEGQVVAAVAAL